MREFASKGRLLPVLVVAASVMGGFAGALLGTCGPFTDVAADVFCPGVLEIFYLGITTGTSATTYDPASNVTRLQMAAFLARTVDTVLKRGSRRAALNQFWTSQNSSVLGLTTVGTGPNYLRSDGKDIWVSDSSAGKIFRVRASDGKLLESWTGTPDAQQVLVAMGSIFVTGSTIGFPSKLYRIDPSQPAGAVTTVASTLSTSAHGLAFDGSRIWTANNGGSVSIVTPGATIPWTVTNVVAEAPLGVVYDGGNIWVTDEALGALLKLDTAGTILQTVTVGTDPQYPTFDGSNIWVPVSGPPSSVAVVRASTGVLLANLTGNGVDFPSEAAFDGQRIMTLSGNVASLWKAADLSPIGSFPLGAGVITNGVCSDGLNFWIAFHTPGQLARF